jgi:WD40 repeat protein
VILDVKNDQMKILNKLKNHEDSINCLCWYPSIQNSDELEDPALLDKIRINLENVSNLNRVLCSSSEDKTIRFWCSEKGIQLKCIKAPGLSTVVDAKSTKNTKNQAQVQTAKINYTPLCWPTGQFLLSGSFKYVI